MSGYRILIVDDSPETIAVTRKALDLSGQGYVFDIAGNGLEALALIDNTRPDLIITDWDMPEMDGLELIVALRGSENTAEIPVIMLTGMMASPESLHDAFEKGASDFLRKPFDKTELLARVKSHLLLASSIKETKAAHEEMVESKKRELVASAIRLIHMSEMNARLIDDLTALEQHCTPQGKELVDKIMSKYRLNSLDATWKEFEMRFEKVYDEFYERLAALHPDLTPGEKKICALLRLNLSSKEIAALTFQDAKSVDMARYRLRKKLNLDQEENLTAYVMKI